MLKLSQLYQLALLSNENCYCIFITALCSMCVFFLKSTYVFLTLNRPEKLAVKEQRGQNELSLLKKQPKKQRKSKEVSLKPRKPLKATLNERFLICVDL
jgi:hypothetical protein